MTIRELARKHNIPEENVYQSRRLNGFLYRLLILKEQFESLDKQTQEKCLSIKANNVQLADKFGVTKQSIGQSKKKDGYAYDYYLLKYQMLTAGLEVDI